MTSDRVHPLGESSQPCATVGGRGAGAVVHHVGANPPVLARQDDFAWADVVASQLEIPLPCVSATLGAARRHRAITILNPAPVPSAPLDMLALVDYLTPNAGEAARLSGLSVHTPADAVPAAHVLKAAGAKTVVVTLGDQGALEELRALAREAVDPDKGYATHPITITLNNLAVEEAYRGAGPKATADALLAAADLAGRRGLERPSRWYRGNLAEAFYDLGKWDDVLEIWTDIEAWEEVRGQSAIGAFAPPWAARILPARGQLDEAAALVEAQLPRARAFEGDALMSPILIAAAIVDDARNDTPSAVASSRSSQQLPGPLWRSCRSL